MNKWVKKKRNRANKPIEQLIQYMRYNIFLWCVMVQMSSEQWPHLNSIVISLSRICENECEREKNDAFPLFTAIFRHCRHCCCCIACPMLVFRLILPFCLDLPSDYILWALLFSFFLFASLCPSSICISLQSSLSSFVLLSLFSSFF